MIALQRKCDQLNYTKKFTTLFIDLSAIAIYKTELFFHVACIV